MVAPEAGPAPVLVLAADRRLVAAVRGFLEPAGHRVAELACSPPPAEAAAAEAAGRARAVLADWQLRTAEGRHLGAALRQRHPGLRLLAVVPPGTARPEPAGWDAVLALPLARDALMRGLALGFEGPAAESPHGPEGEEGAAG